MMFQFFTVYGPWERPDLALHKFVDAILDDQPIDIYNNGEMYRDFTYMDDLLHQLTGYRPQTHFRHGIASFVKWFREYFQK